MSCKYKEDCPCCSGWCDSPKQDYEQCVQFLITAHARDTEELERSEDKNVQYQDTINRIKRICDGRG